MTNELNRHYMISILVDRKAADWWNERKQKFVIWEQIHQQKLCPASDASDALDAGTQST